jgi:septal ring factor EnvC (AmiA/AmiB activator)
VTEVSLEFISQQLERVLTEQAIIRDDIIVVTAMVTRLEASLQALTVEVRAIQRQIARMNDRVTKLEDAR